MSTSSLARFQGRDRRKNELLGFNGSFQESVRMVSLTGVQTGDVKSDASTIRLTRHQASGSG